MAVATAGESSPAAGGASVAPALSGVVDVVAAGSGSGSGSAGVAAGGAASGDAAFVVGVAESSVELLAPATSASSSSHFRQ